MIEKAAEESAAFALQNELSMLFYLQQQFQRLLPESQLLFQNSRLAFRRINPAYKNVYERICLWEKVTLQ